MPKLLWREPIVTTTITSAAPAPAEQEHPDNALGTQPGSERVVSTEASASGARVLTVGDIAGRESGGLIVLLVASVRSHWPATSSSPAATCPTSRGRWPSSASSPWGSCW